jgi:hypothetical protein
LAKALETAIRANDRDAAVRLIQMLPELLHLPVISGDWGPPMSHAANLGRLEIAQAMAALGARDFQHAFDRGFRGGSSARAGCMDMASMFLGPPSGGHYQCGSLKTGRSRRYLRCRP